MFFNEEREHHRLFKLFLVIMFFRIFVALPIAILFLGIGDPILILLTFLFLFFLLWLLVDDFHHLIHHLIQRSN
jgi:hypothetical protein